MGKLLNMAIAGSKATATTASLSLFSELGTSTTNRARWTKNGTLQGTFTGLSNFTLNSGDTFFITAINTMGATLNITKNGGGVYSNSDTALMTSTTFTVAGGDVFVVEALLGL